MNVFKKEDGEESELDPSKAFFAFNIAFPVAEDSIDWENLFEAEVNEYRVHFHTHLQPCYSSFGGRCCREW